MEKSAATPGPLPSPAKGGNKLTRESSSGIDQSLYQQHLFLSMALSMTGQLALVVVIPIVGGHLVDVRYHLTPWLTLAGLAVAAVCVVGVLTRIVAESKKRSDYQTRGKV